MRNNFIVTTLLGLAALAIPAAADQNLVIVSIGDSVASGEGNPDSYNGIPGAAGWLSARCHQSVNNGRRFASNRINALPNFSTEFYDFSCSGAGIEFGLLNDQETNQPFVTNGDVTAQITRVKNFQTSSGGLNNRPIDILMISIGANDANFGDVVTTCVTDAGDCTTTSAVHAAVNRIPQVLPGLYDQLAAAIHTLNVKHVYFTEYPDEMASRPGDFCGDQLDNGSGDASMVAQGQAENAFLFQHFVVPLNNQIGAAVTRASSQFPSIVWRRISGPQSTFSTHGYCTPPARRYANTLSDSIVRQGDQKGTMHPNIGGHEAYADALIAQATADFNLPIEQPRVERIVESNTGLPVPPLFAPNPAAPFNRKSVLVEVGQHPGTLTATLLSRIRTPGQAAPPFTRTAMDRASSGLPNQFSAEIPGSETTPGFNPFALEWIEFQVQVTATRNGDTVSSNTGTHSITAGQFLSQ